MKDSGRVKMPKTRVYHYNIDIDECHICGKAARHAIVRVDKHGKLRPSHQRLLYLCTKHLTQMFKLPANRHPKMVKKFVAPKLEKVRDFALRQHMDTPYYFRGERELFHDMRLGGAHVFFALYRKEDTKDGSNLVISMATVFDKKNAINLVAVPTSADDVLDCIKHLMHTMGNMIELDQKSVLVLSMGVSKFIEKIHVLSKTRFESEQAAHDAGG